MLNTYTEEFIDTINWMHTVIFSCKREQLQMGQVGRAAACLDSTHKTCEEWWEIVFQDVTASKKNLSLGCN